MTENFGYRTGAAQIALSMEDFYVWDCSVVYSGGKYHMFSSRWPKELGFGYNWLLHSQIVHSTSEKPEGPYHFENVVLAPRGPEYFDGMNTHNTCIKAWNGKFYLYYMGCTYSPEIPASRDPELDGQLFVEIWNRKRIGLAVADSPDGPFVRRDTPLLEPRDCSHWDCTITTNPTVAILPDGKTYLIYKSRRSVGSPLQLGVAVADTPEGPFRRLCDRPILEFADPDLHVEDPFLWYECRRKKFCLIAKDDCKNGSAGITGEWGSGFYAESDDCIHFALAPSPKVYSRKIRWTDGHTGVQCNLERPSLLFDEQGNPTHLFCASGSGNSPYAFEDGTCILSFPLEKENEIP